jgi:hypothetical protein
MGLTHETFEQKATKLLAQILTQQTVPDFINYPMYFNWHLPKYFNWHLPKPILKPRQRSQHIFE